MHKRQFGILYQSSIWAFDGISLINFIKVLKNQIWDNIFPKVMMQSIVKKVEAKKILIFLCLLSENFMLVFEENRVLDM